ncbi:diacylglycerol/lipid kinase family protein [Persicitalea jodogahamensis]|uniref:Diacylglycerol kinase n=1 Tax=Persicitalea jodogahamensis TaxID=402147 RepID=A0A8J3D1L7_9BACT|nr:diacylglycerol kinase family protein [Persicitalea jodogahamensis]GHB64545.1 diacylglycerol kinase [Persicitalea jodogahamensis]
MPSVQLIHNPGAGDEEHTKKKLVKAIKTRGYECRYSSTKEKGWDAWEVPEQEVDFIALAGGDGTVRKVTAKLLKRTLLEKQFPIALLPLGTANNIGTTLRLPHDTEVLMDSWPTAGIKNFDVGIVNGPKESAFFLEGFGYGLFPGLMKEMKSVGEKEDATPEEKIDQALQTLHGILQNFEARKCHLEVDGQDISGKFLLVEIMNTRSLGPNLHLAPDADPGDGYLNVAVINENQRSDFSQYLMDRIHGDSKPFSYHTYQAQKVTIQWEGTLAHADDELIKLKKGTMAEVGIRAGVLEFMVP